MSADLRRLLGAILAAESGADAVVDELVAPLHRTVSPGRSALDVLVDRLVERHAAALGAPDPGVAHTLAPGGRGLHPLDHDSALAAQPGSRLLRALAWLSVDPVRAAELALAALEAAPEEALAVGQAHVLAADALRRAGLVIAAVGHADRACGLFLEHRDHNAGALSRAASAARLASAFDLRVDLARQQGDHVGAMAWVRRARLADLTSPRVAASRARPRLELTCV